MSRVGYVLKHGLSQRPSSRLAAGVYFISYSLVCIPLRVCASERSVCLRAKIWERTCGPAAALASSRGWRAPENKQKLDVAMAGMDLMLSSSEPGDASAEKVKFAIYF